MPFVVCNEGKLMLANVITGDQGTPTFAMALASTTHTPAPGDTLITYSATELTFTGYSQVSLTRNFPNVVTSDFGVIEYPDAVFTASGAVSPSQTANCYYVWDNTNFKLLGAEVISPGFIFASIGDALTIEAWKLKDFDKSQC